MGKLKVGNGVGGGVVFQYSIKHSWHQTNYVQYFKFSKFIAKDIDIIHVQLCMKNGLQ